MKNNKILGIVVWGIGFLLSILSLFCLSKQYTSVIWVTLGFTSVAYLSQMFLWLCLWKKALTPAELFLYYPVFTISVAYLILQVILCVVFAFYSIVISTKIVIFINAFVMILAFLLLALSMIACNSIHNKDHR